MQISTSRKVQAAAVGAFILAGGAYYVYKKREAEEFERNLPKLLESNAINTIRTHGSLIKSFLFSKFEEDEYLPIHLSASVGSNDCFLHLADLHEDFLIENKHGCNVIHLSLRYGQKDTFELILQRLKSQGKNPTEVLKQQKFVAQGLNLFQLAANGKNNELLESLFDLMPVDINYQDQRGCTLLHHVISYKPNAAFVKRILRRFDVDLSLVDSTNKSLFHFATWTGDSDLLKALLDEKPDSKLLNLNDRAGKTPLHLASVMGHTECMRLLLEFGVNINAESRDGATPLLICDSVETCDMLLKAGADTTKMDRFGSTALHLAISQGRLDVALSLSAHGGKALNAYDNDGFRPMDMLVFSTRTCSDVTPEKWVDLAKSLVENKADINATDLGGQTILHKLMNTPTKSGPYLLKYFLSIGGRELAETKDDDGRSALHLAGEEAASFGMDAILRTYCSGAFLNGMKEVSEDSKKSNENYLLKRGAHCRIPFERRKRVLNGEHNLSGFAKCLKRMIAEKPDLKILIMVGAGISVNCGIPDFRSKKGVYQKYDANIFTLDGVINHSEDFYGLVRDCFMPVRDGVFKPAPTHYFFKLLHDKGHLQRVYTQNIDGLEKMAGLPDDMVIKAHGDFDEAICTKCANPVKMEKFWEEIKAGGVPTCDKCGGVARPCVTFFGESLKSEVFSNQEDFSKADALIVMGTTLMVYPFAGFVNDVSDMTPRLLINKEGTGPFKQMPDEGAKDPGARYRDARFLGDCDEGVKVLATEMGWGSDLSVLLS